MVVISDKLTPQELLKAANRLRLTRAGLLKIMRENEERERQKEVTKTALDVELRD